jgi:predicted short-subunit dehydrogenase-like oxidoreductase (DUF2520 family)
LLQESSLFGTTGPAVTKADKGRLNIGFIGIGVLGKGLALAMTARGYRVTAAYSRSPASAQWLAGRVEHCRVAYSAQELADACDVVFITTPDGVIGQVAGALRWRTGQGVVHCSGAASTKILQGAADQGATVGAFHPFQTFAGLEQPEEAAARLEGVTFAVSARDWLESFLQGLARDLGGRPVAIADADRPLYHASAVLGCGYLAALLQCALEPWRAMGFTQAQALEALYPLARVTLENIYRHGIRASVTGPVVRGDTQTVEAHLAALAQRLPQVVPVYAALARASLPLAAGQAGDDNRIEDPEKLENLQRVLDNYCGRCLPCPE